MPRFSQAFGVKKSQGELDFVDVPLHTDIWLFIDPFAISQRPDPWSQRCHATLVAFFQKVVDHIRAGRLEEARNLLSHLQEPNETHFGLSAKRPAGAGIGPYQAQQLFEALKASTAVKTGFLSSLEECELMIDGIGHDKISDLTTNVVRGHLVEYTQAQCELHGVPVQMVALGSCFNSDSLEWESRYGRLPVWKGKPVLLVPKVLARLAIAYDHQKYYRHYVLNYLQAEAIEAGSSLVRTLRNKKRKVLKKDVEKAYPCTKEFLYQFSKDHPEVLQKYREDLARLEKRAPLEALEPEDESAIAGALSAVLKSIPPGVTAASEYHSLMIGVLEFLFYPQLINPRKEREIHQGRKRIDIVMENGARDGVLYRLHDVRKLPCSFVAIECKNYSTEVANPEIDQLSGRFSVNRGKFGLLCCRTFEGRANFVERCRDTFKDDRGLVVPFDDDLILRLLDRVQKGRKDEIERALMLAIDEVWVS
jgi:hypothetical protein